MSPSRVVVIGGGASGLVAAIAAARLGADVGILEKGARVGRKILATGNGRCNLSNRDVAPAAYNQPDFVEPVFAAVPPASVTAFFDGLGLLTSTDEEGRVYPVTNAASSVLDVLRLECARLGVEERCGFEVARIATTRDAAGFDIISSDGDRLHAGAVVVATGGGHSVLAGLGHTSVSCTPVLGPLKTEREPIRGLSGVRVRCSATLLVDGSPVATERGELLFRDYGASGIMIFDLSRFFKPGCVLSIDLLPDIAVDELHRLLSERCATFSWRTAETFFEGMLHDRVAHAVLRAARVPPASPVLELPCERLAALLKDFRLNVIGRGDAAQSQVTRGGATVAEFDSRTMQSRTVSGLFAAGEVLDIDGPCGGFNLHWAWASGIVAGESAARFAGACAGQPESESGASA